MAAADSALNPPDALNVAIIGGGVAGVATCKALAVRSIPCTLFEPQPCVGGLWVDNYPGAGIQAPHKLYEYADAPFPKPAADLASAAEVIAYCEAYVRQWGLEGHLRLSTRVERVTQRPGGGFIVETRPAGGDAGSEAARAEFTHVVVCTGMFSNVGSMPDVTGLDTFGGLLLHSSERRDDAAELAGRHVMVVGGGKSAQDAAAAAVQAGAASVVLATRRPHLMVPLRLFGIIPVQWAFLSQMGEAVLPPYPGRRSMPTVRRAAGTLTRRVRLLMQHHLKLVLMLHYRLPVRLWPRGSLDREMMGSRGMSMYSKDFIRGARSGAIDVRVAEVTSVGGASVTLRHGAQEGKRAGTEEKFPVDTLIFATGFTEHLPFLDAGIQEALGRQPDGLPLYRHIVPPSLPGLFFVGMAITIAAPLTASVQGAWVGELLQGRVTLPDEEAMHAESARWSDALAIAPLSSARRHIVAQQGNRYAFELLRDMGVEHLARYGGPFGPVANAVMPQNPENFRNAVQPPGGRTNRRLGPPLWLKAAVVVAVAGAAQVVRGCARAAERSIAPRCSGKLLHSS